MSPDLNPIEHVWDMFDRRVRKRPAAPLTLQELADALIEELELDGAASLELVHTANF
jgi:transposase